MTSARAAARPATRSSARSGRRVDALPEPARHALLVAACAETVRADVIAGALANAGLPPDALEPAEAAGLLTLRGREIEFDHPLVRAAVYHGGQPVRAPRRPPRARRRLPGPQRREGLAPRRGRADAGRRRRRRR